MCDDILNKQNITLKYNDDKNDTKPKNIHIYVNITFCGIQILQGGGGLLLK